MTDNSEALPVEKQEAAITETPEFQMAVAAEVAKAIAEIKGNLLAEVKAVAGAGTPSAVDQSGVSLAREIALAVSQMADQGTGRKRVPVEILKAREEGQKEMERLLMEARKLPKGEQPRYRLIAAGYFKDKLVQPFQRNVRTGEDYPTEIVYLAIPGQHMKPLNVSAKRIFAAYLRSISNNEDSEVPLTHKPVWVTDSGVQIAGGGTATARAHGRVIDPMGEDGYDPDAPDVSGPQDDDEFGIINQSDPRAREINVLGTIAEPAKRSSVVDRASRQMRGAA